MLTLETYPEASKPEKNLRPVISETKALEA